MDRASKSRPRFGLLSAPLVVAALAPMVLFGARPAGADLVSHDTPAAPVQTRPSSPTRPETGRTGVPSADGTASREKDLTRAESDYFSREPGRARIAGAGHLGVTLVIVGIVAAAAIIWFGATHEEWPW